MRIKALPSAGGVLAFLALVGGVLLIAVSAWTRPLSQGARAAEAGDLETALERFGAGEARFDRVPLFKRVMPAAYEASVANQLQIQYRLKQLDALIDKAASAPPSGPSHFWAGCAFYEKARVEQDADARIGYLDRAADEFRQALEHAPLDWNAKYNYELSSRLLAQIEREPKTPQKQLLELLRPMPTPTGESVRPIG